MAESNFVDYVKIYCRSGKGGRGSTHMRREKYIPNGCCICATTAMHWQDMENPVPRTAVLVRMEKIRLLKFPVAQWYTMPKQANISVTSPSMDKKLFC